jgi:hypothetical protein
VLLDQIADGQRLIGGDQRADQTDEKFVHANNVSVWKNESRCKQVAPGLNYGVVCLRWKCAEDSAHHSSSRKQFAKMAGNSFRCAQTGCPGLRVMLPPLLFFDGSAAATKIKPRLCAPMNLSTARCENLILNLMSDECDDAHATCRIMFSLP